MKISKERLKEIIKDVLREETEYQKFFAKALKNLVIYSTNLMMKRKFFNKIDAAWKGKGEKRKLKNENRKVERNR